MTDQSDLLDEVAHLLRQVSDEIVLPRFGSLGVGDVREKAPGDVVSVADTEAEQFLAEGLRAVLPAIVVGEESVAADPSLLHAVGPGDRAWIVDPIDGTSSFVAGSPAFAVMVALWDGGATAASWILHPVSGRMFTAARGVGAWVDGEQIRRSPAPTDLSSLRVVVRTRFLASPVAAAVERRTADLGQAGEGTLAAGHEYPRLVTDDLDAALWWRTYPWDHAPGALLVEESGGRVARLDGSPYDPWDAEGRGLLAAADPATFDRVAATLAPRGRLDP